MAITTEERSMNVDFKLGDPALMPFFYKHMFPYKPLFLWLNQDQIPSKLFTHRELALTLQNDVYLRYQSFNTSEEFKKSIRDYCPSRFEIGPQYTARPRDRKTLAAGALQPQRRELVFDIDMTDYDEIRTCCSDKKICKKCWGFIAAAVKVLDHTLRETFGFKHLMWVYSGRRGIHCWISDQKALDLNDDQRRNLVNFLEVIKGGSQQSKKVSVRGKDGNDAPHPYLQETIITLSQLFPRLILYEQDCFREEKGWELLLELLPGDRAVNSVLRTKWEADPGRSSHDKWNDLTAILHKNIDTPLGNKIKHAIEDIILQYTYPRIDSEVSKHRNHLLKSPFVVHPGTGRICVPINPSIIDEFDPETVPTVNLLHSEFNQYQARKKEEGAESTGRRMEDYEHTSLAPYVGMFEKHISAIMRDNRNAKKAVKKNNLDF
ncbi:hypothetical protein L202_04112 [Cryptococcus amylolentus CBS 6039]|uniref:DNA primase n=1 Tax=Cryptococcus amylolentus CBS 6039 TaxID=1295533 RepID=A0A1E3HQ61_9TREE|nr:hypothetical protein L202_04112 [Cryptococcus amylolentus CBS 6039]ODN78478.1 hypothetical protein L202_04112 [Cryptococcus amylolentus CBS 6039]